MNVEKWIEENAASYQDGMKDVRAIRTGKLRELLKTHAIVPREPTKAMKEAFHDTYLEYEDGPYAGECPDVQWAAMIAASEAGDEKALTERCPHCKKKVPAWNVECPHCGKINRGNM